MKPTSLTLLLSRVIRAPRPRVFAAFSSIDQLKKWFGPEDCHVIDGEVDFRRGGQYRLTLHTTTFGQAELSGSYEEIVPNQRLRFTWTWGKNAAMATWGDMTVTIDFTDHPDGTLVTIKHDGILEEQVREGHSHGWNGSFDKLEQYCNNPTTQKITIPMSDQANQPDTTPGIISWNEMVSRDPAASQKFYTQLFGWTAETMDMGPGGDYTILKTGGRPAAGLLRMPAEAGPAPTMWMSYVTVTDLPAAVAKAQALGAKLCKDITSIPIGRFAIITDPQGAAIGLWEFTKQP